MVVIDCVVRGSGEGKRSRVVEFVDKRHGVYKEKHDLEKGKFKNRFFMCLTSYLSVTN